MESLKRFNTATTSIDNGDHTYSTSTPKMARLDSSVARQCAQCVVCSQSAVTQHSYLLPCLHSICSEDCINDETLKSDGCSKCRSRNNLGPQYPPNYLFRYTAAFKSEQKRECSICISKNPASRWCKNCQAYLCEPCVEGHKVMKKTVSHVLTSFEDHIEALVAPKVVDAIYCREVSEHGLLMCCSVCEKSYCAACKGAGAGDHEGHELKTLSDVIKDLNQELDQNKPDISNFWTRKFGFVNNMNQSGREFTLNSLITLAEEVKKMTIEFQKEVAIGGIQLSQLVGIQCEAHAKKTGVTKETLLKFKSEIMQYLRYLPILLDSPPILHPLEAPTIHKRIEFFQEFISRAYCSCCGIDDKCTVQPAIDSENVLEEIDKYLNKVYKIQVMKPEYMN